MNNKKEKKKVIMSATFMVHTKSEVSLSDLVDSGRGYVDIGGFEVIAKGKTIPFDFESCSWWQEKRFHNGNPLPINHLYSYSNYNGFAEKIHDVDPCHTEDWAKVGLKLEDITAELLGSAEELVEFYVNVTDEDDNPIPFTLEVVSMVFENEDGKVFSINTEVLRRFNRKLRQADKN